jgi:hypothetical protein
LRPGSSECASAKPLFFSYYKPNPPPRYEEKLVAEFSLIQPPVERGFLQKKGHFRHSWKKRFFVLATHMDSPSEQYRLVYFAKPPGDEHEWKRSESKAKGKVLLSGAVVTTANSKAKNQNKPANNF